MASDQFPVFRTKTPGVDKKFDLNNVASRQEYFKAKAGPEIEKLKKYLESNSAFVAFLLGKKNSGKGTYSKMFQETVNPGKVGHLSVGDLVRDIHQALENPETKNQLLEFLKKNYRGFHSVEGFGG